MHGKAGPSRLNNYWPVPAIRPPRLLIWRASPATDSTTCPGMVHRLRSGKKTMPDFPKQASAYWFEPEPVKGSEMRKVRPCIVISPDEMNQNLQTVIIVPLTSTIQAWPFRVTIHLLGHKSSAACDQLRAVDKSRLKARIGSLRPADKDRLFNLLQTIFSE